MVHQVSKANWTLQAECGPDSAAIVGSAAAEMMLLPHMLLDIQMQGCNAFLMSSEPH